MASAPRHDDRSALRSDLSGTSEGVRTPGLDVWGFDHSQDGMYRNSKTKKIVAVHGIHHFRDGSGRIQVSFRGTREGKPFGRTFQASIEDFFSRHCKSMEA